MHLDLNLRRIPGYVPALLLVAGSALVLTGLVALQVVGVGLLLIAFAVPIVGTVSRREDGPPLPPIFFNRTFSSHEEEDEPAPPARGRHEAFDEEDEPAPPAKGRHEADVSPQHREFTRQRLANIEQQRQLREGRQRLANIEQQRQLREGRQR